MGSILASIAQIEQGLRGLYEAASLLPPDRPIEKRVASAIAQRGLRLRLFSPHLFSDPAWDLLLELYAMELKHGRVNISRLTEASGVPPTTVLRWIDKLDAEALIVRQKDIHDARRVWVSLSQYGLSLMNRYFQAVGSEGPSG